MWSAYLKAEKLQVVLLNNKKVIEHFMELILRVP